MMVNAMTVVFARQFMTLSVVVMETHTLMNVKQIVKGLK